MRYKTLGRTGLFVSEFALGTMTFGTPEAHYATAGGLQQEAVLEIVRFALDAGINFLDTANVYSNGQSEELVGHALKTMGIARSDVVLATKAEHATGTGPNDGGASRFHIMHQVEASLRRLGTDHIDLYQMHGWDPVTPVEETLRALDDLVTSGKVRYVGVSNWAAWQAATALGVADRLNLSRPQSVQGYYSLAGRDAERDIVPMLEAAGLSMIVYSPLAGGYLSGKYMNGKAEGRRATIPFPPVDESRGESTLAALAAVAARHGLPMGVVALAWLTRKPVVASVILGVKRIEQLKENLTAGDVTLSEDDVVQLDQASSLPVEYPGWMLPQAETGRLALQRTGQLGKAAW